MEELRRLLGGSKPRSLQGWGLSCRGLRQRSLTLPGSHWDTHAKRYMPQGGTNPSSGTENPNNRTVLPHNQGKLAVPNAGSEGSLSHVRAAPSLPSECPATLAPHP